MIGPAFLDADQYNRIRRGSFKRRHGQSRSVTGSGDPPPSGPYEVIELTCGVIALLARINLAGTGKQAVITEPLHALLVIVEGVEIEPGAGTLIERRKSAPVGAK